MFRSGAQLSLGLAAYNLLVLLTVMLLENLKKKASTAFKAEKRIVRKKTFCCRV